MTPGSVIRLLASLLVTGGLIAGCASDRSYRYEEIKAEYAGRARTAKQTEKPPGARPAPAAVSRLDRPITLADAVKTALSGNPDVKIAAARIDQAHAAGQKARAAFYPQLGFYTEYTRADAPSVYLFKTIDQRQLAPGTDFNQPGLLNNYESGLNARYNLYNGGRDSRSQDMAQTGLTISQLQQREVENRLVAAVIHAYYDALAAGDFIHIAAESVATVQKELEIMRVRFEGGEVLKSDLLSLDVRLAQSREEVVRSRNRHQLALSALTSVMGVGPETELQLRPVEGFDLDLPPRFAAGVSYGLEHRAEVGTLQQQVRQSRMALDQSRSTRLPTLDLTARYYLDDDAMAYDLDRDNWVVAVMFNWNIFTGFSSEADEARAEAALEEILAADVRTGLTVKQDIKNAYLNLEAAKARLEVARQSVASAEESLDLVQRQFEGGAATITRYLETELDRNRARIRATAAFYDAQKSLADIARAIGYWGETGQIP